MGVTKWGMVHRCRVGLRGSPEAQEQLLAAWVAFRSLKQNPLAAHSLRSWLIQLDRPGAHRKESRRPDWRSPGLAPRGIHLSGAGTSPGGTKSVFSKQP